MAEARKLNDEGDEEVQLTSSRDRHLRVARSGYPNAVRLSIKEKSLLISQYRACVALLWTREQILEETGWSLQQLMGIEKAADEEDERTWARGADPVSIFSEYRERQLMAARELEDLALAFRAGGQFSALVTAIKARSDILDKVIKCGQDLGLIKRSPREIRFRGKVDIKAMNVQELRVLLGREIRQLHKLIDPHRSNVVEGTAGVVLQRILRSGEGESSPKPPTAEEPKEAKEEVEKPRSRVKRLAPGSP